MQGDELRDGGLDLGAIQGRCDRAAEHGTGPYTHRFVRGPYARYEVVDPKGRAVSEAWTEADADFDAHARSDVPALVAETGGPALLVERCGGQARWAQVDGHRWAWVGDRSLASTFTWGEARDVLWKKLKTLNHDGLGNPTSPPRTDRWRYKLARILPKGSAAGAGTRSP